MSTATIPFSGLTPVPVVLYLNAEQAAQLAGCAARFKCTESEAASAMVVFGQHALMQLGDSEDRDLPAALLRRFSVHESLIHRLGVALAEAERINLLEEALAIEAKHLLARVRDKKIAIIISDYVKILWYGFRWGVWPWEGRAHAS